jgi:hypothetical protein
MKKVLMIALGMLILLTGCGNAFRVYHDYDHEVDFSRYKTYSFLDWTEGNREVITGMERERIRAAFSRELEKMGFEYADQGADLAVKITVYFREARRPIYGFYYPDYYNYVERALAVDIFERESKRHVWHGAAVGEVEQSPEKRAEELPEQVAKIFEKFPSGAE